MAGYIGSKASVVSNGAERKKVFDITTTTTSLTGCSYTPNQVHVFHNGVRLVDGTDYTATDGSTVTLTTAAQSGDEVVVISYATFQTSDTVSASAGGTFSNAVTIDANGATVLTVDRATSDGTIIDLQKDGTTIGEIGVDSSGFLYIGKPNLAGLKFQSGNIIPVTGGVGANNTYALGGSATKFTNLYLSGGVYLGGTGAANYLDDYEEGTFTPVIANGTYTFSNVLGLYRKIGDTVFVHIGFRIGTASGVTAAGGQISGLPFTSDSKGAYRESHARIAVGGNFVTANLGANLTWYVANTNTILYARTTSANADTPVASNAIWQNNTFMKLQLQYQIA